MEKNEKNSKVPDWVNIVKELPEIVQQGIGNQCASVIASLVQLYMVDSHLCNCVLDDAFKFFGQLDNDGSSHDEGIQS